MISVGPARIALRRGTTLREYAGMKRIHVSRYVWPCLTALQEQCLIVGAVEFRGFVRAAGKHSDQEGGKSEPHSSGMQTFWGIPGGGEIKEEYVCRLVLREEGVCSGFSCIIELSIKSNAGISNVNKMGRIQRLPPPAFQKVASALGDHKQGRAVGPARQRFSQGCSPFISQQLLVLPSHTRSPSVRWGVRVGLGVLGATLQPTHSCHPLRGRAECSK